MKNLQAFIKSLYARHEIACIAGITFSLFLVLPLLVSFIWGAAAGKLTFLAVALAFSGLGAWAVLNFLNDFLNGKDSES